MRYGQAVHHPEVPPELCSVFAAQGGVATSPQILAHLSRRLMQRHLRFGVLSRIWPNIYSLGVADTFTRLRGLDLRCGQPVAVCVATAAGIFGFDTENVTALHVLNPEGNLLRDSPDLVVHRRDGAPLMTFHGREMTTPAWTAIEVARAGRRPRALAALDAALRSGMCEPPDLLQAALGQAGRRGIVVVRDLIPLARPEAESPMESEARLVMLDGGLPEPVLQYEVVDYGGRHWRLNFAWPEAMVAVEYDGFDWHSSPEDLRRDRQKRAALEEMRWRLVSIVSDDVRRRPVGMVRRIGLAISA